MSFRDLGSKGTTRHRREEETGFEANIKANIQEIQDLVHRANEQLEQAERSYLSKRGAESLDRYMERSHQLAQETERLFRDWTVHFAGEPAERHRKKFSYEKLQRAFEEEVAHVKDVARRTLAAQKEAWTTTTSTSSRLSAANSSSAKPPKEIRPVCDEQNESLLCPEADVEHGLLEDAAQSQGTVIRSRIAQEREESIRRIQSQVHEVNQIFRDLASIVHEQGHEIESIEHTADSASRETKQAATELRKAADRQRGSRERLCCMLTAAVVLLFLIVLPHMHMSELHRFDPAPKAPSAASAASASETAPK